MPKISKPLSQKIRITADYIRHDYGGMLSVTQVTKLLGMRNRKSADKWLADVDYININGRKRYMALDLAKKIEMHRQSGDAE